MVNSTREVNFQFYHFIFSYFLLIFLFLIFILQKSLWYPKQYLFEEKKTNTLKLSVEFTKFEIVKKTGQNC